MITRLAESSDLAAVLENFRLSIADAGAPAARALYLRLGYARVGLVRFPRRHLAFECMELNLTGPTRAEQPGGGEPGNGARDDHRGPAVSGR